MVLNLNALSEIIFLTLKKRIFNLFINYPSRLVGKSFRKLMATLAIEIKRAEAAGDKKITGFTGAVRSLENLNLEVGDEWTFPTTFDVYEQKIGDSVAQYIFVEINGNAKKFYPSTFTKSRTIYNEDGTSTSTRVHTEGTAAELFRTAGSINEAMQLLAGKKVKVTNMKTVRTLRYGTTTLMNATIPTIDLAE